MKSVKYLVFICILFASLQLSCKNKSSLNPSQTGWFWLNPNPQGSLESVYFINNNTGYVAGGRFIAKTTDGGVTWINKHSYAGPRIKCVQFPKGELTGFAVGSYSGYNMVMQTMDGGKQWFPWTPQKQDNLGELFSVCFPVDTQTGYVAGFYGVILKTTDGGSNWLKIFSSREGLALYSIHFPLDVLTGFAVGELGQIVKTTDGGVTWSIQPSGTEFKLNSVCFPRNVQTGYAVGAGGTILKTTNGGINWASLNSGISRNLSSINFPVDYRTGYLVGEGGTILKTTDSGVSWVIQKTAFTNILLSVQFPIDAKTGYAIVSDNLLKTVTGGI